MRAISALIILGLAAPALAAPVLDTPVKDDYWSAGRAALEQRMTIANRPKRARNVILMIGDGMGIATITAARIFDGQHPTDGSPRRPGEENSLAFEKLPYSALVKTYNSNAQVPDSAGTASAMNIGVKTRIGTINFGQDQLASACATPDRLPRTFAELAKREGLAVGVVTTTRITHATPAAVYGHVPNRNWEGADKAFPAADRASGCADIARQLVDFDVASPGGAGLEVALGGGLPPLAAVRGLVEHAEGEQHRCFGHLHRKRVNIDPGHLRGNLFGGQIGVQLAQPIHGGNQK